MKTIVLIFVFLTINFTKTYAQCDSVYSWIDFTTGGSEESTEKSVVHYSSSGKIISDIIYRNDYPDYRWKNSRQVLYFYDSNDSLIQILNQVGNDTSWTNSYQTLFTYDSFGNLTQKKTQIWNGNSWVDDYTRSYSYDIQNNQLSYTNVTSTSTTRILYGYNAMNQDTNEIYQHLDSTSQWINDTRTDLYYDVNGLKILTVKFTWETSVWDTASRSIYTYLGIDNDSLITQILDTTWKNQTLAYNEYSPFHQVIHAYDLYWQDTAWIYSHQRVNEVDQYGYPNYQNNFNATYDSFGVLYWEPTQAPYYTTYDSLGKIISFDGHGFPGGPSYGNYNYTGSALDSYFTHSETMGGIPTDHARYYYYANIIGDSVICAGNSTTLSLDSCAGYSYLWSTGETTASIVVSTPGLYSATVDHSNGFVAHTSEIRVQTVSGVPYIQTGIDSIFNACANRQLYLQAPNQANAHFQWFRNDSVLVNQTNSIYSVYGNLIIAGDYYLVAYNACGLDTSAHTNVILNQPPPAPTITANGPTTFCVGDSVTLTSSLGAGYYWYQGGPNTQSITVGSTATYYVSVYGANGCLSSYTSIHTTARPLPTTPIHVYIGNGGITTNYTGTCQWFFNGDTIPGATGSTIFPTVAGYYSHTSATYPPCFSYSDTLYFDPSVLYVNAGPDKYVCLNVQIYIGAASPAYGGTPPYSYQWTIAPHLTNFGNGVARIDTVLNDAVYYLRVTDAMGLIARDTVYVYTNSTQPPYLTIGGQKPLCKNSYHYFVANNYGSSFTVLNWIVNGDSIAFPYSTFSYTNSGIYQVVIRDQYGCKLISDPDTIQMYDSYPKPVIHADLDTNACITGIGTVWVNSELGSNYYWKLQPNQIISYDTLAQIAYPTDYQVYVTDSNNCSATSFISFDSFNANIDCQIQFTGNYLCSSDSIMAYAPVFTGWSYDWYRNNISLGVNSDSLQINLPGSYTFRASSPDGCTASSYDYSILSSSNFTVNIQLVNGTLRPDTTGGFSYQWFLDGVEIPGALASTFNPVSTGTYTLRLDDSHNCDIFSNSIFVGFCSTTINPIVPIVCDTSCNGSLTAIGQGVGTLQYAWSTGATTNTISNLCPGTYIATVTDSLGCVAIDSAVIIQDTISISLINTNPSCIGCADGIIKILAVDGFPPYVYSIIPNNGPITNDSILNLPAGAYIVCATDVNGCMTCEVDTLFDPPAGIPNLNNGAFSVFPNPVRDEFIITNISNQSIQQYELTIFDAEGREIHLKQETNNRYTISQLRSGVYTLKIIYKDSINYIKIVKQ